MNKENCALKLVDEIILYYDARSKKHQITLMKSEVLTALAMKIMQRFLIMPRSRRRQNIPKRR